MRTLFLSDTHRRHNELDLPSADCVIHCGDGTNTGKVWEVEEFASWFGTIPWIQYKVYVAGNHDFLFETSPQRARDIMLEYGITYLEGDSCMFLDGLKIWGGPWTLPFHDWAFNRRPEELRRLWSKIPEDTDILVTHGPPFEILDRESDGVPLGDMELIQAVSRVKPLVHAFGHIHGGRGIVERDGVAHLNCSICTTRIVGELRKPVLLDITKERVDILSGI